MKNKAVYKYELDIEDYQFIEMPFGSKILSAKVQREVICLWALVNTEEEKKEMKTIYIRGTGNLIIVEESANLKFINTVILRNGAIIFHIFELI